MSSIEKLIKGAGILPLDIGQIIELFDDLIEAIYGVDLNGKCTFCNKRLLRLLDYETPKALLGQNMSQLLHHSDVQGNLRAPGDFELWQCLSLDKIIHKPHDCVWRRDGSSIPVELWAYPYYKNGRVDGAIVAFIDISARVYAQQALEKTLDRYRNLIESTQIIPWEYDLQKGSFTFVSPLAQDMFGYNITEWYLPGFWERIIHPDDRDKTVALCAQTLVEKDNFQLDYRVMKADGGFVYVKDYVTTIRDNDNVVGLRGVFVDISISKIQEEQLRLAAVTFDTDAGIFITDKDGIIVKVNQAFCEITGFTEHQVIGKTPSYFRSDRHDDEFFQRMWNNVQTYGRWRGEVWNQNADGDEFPEWMTITAVRDTNQMISHYVSIFTDISEIKAAEDKIKYQAHYDSVTGLPNRILLANRLQQAIVQARKFYHHGALLLLDLDEFKVINDALGHEFGDRLLTFVGEELQTNLSEGDLLARLGGDEFAILLPDLGGDLGASMEQATAMANSICEFIYNLQQIDTVPVHLTASIGFTLFSSKRVSDSEVLKQADTAMYKAKQSGKNCVMAFSQQMQAEATNRLSLQGQLKQAIELGQLELHFQPQYDEQKRLSGMEALVRWQHPERGLVSPAEFIPIAEKSGLIVPLGRWVIQRACEVMATWRDVWGDKLPRMAVNVSAQQLLQVSFVEMLRDCLRTNRLSALHIELEITEEVLIGDIEHTISVIESLRQLGVHFAIDDFGTGYSSLSYLKKLPIHLLKIDRSFIADVLDDKDDEAIVSTIIAMAKTLGLQVVAEGVENQGQFDWLRQRGCDFYQGFWLNKPLSQQDFENRVLSQLSQEA